MIEFLFGWLSFVMGYFYFCIHAVVRLVYVCLF